MFEPQLTNQTNNSFSNFQCDIFRIRTELVRRVEALEQDLTIHKLDFSILKELERELQVFQSFRKSEFGWQDIHGMDEELIARAEHILEKQGSRRLL